MASSRIAYLLGIEDMYPLGTNSFPAVLVLSSLSFVNNHLCSPWFKNFLYVYLHFRKYSSIAFNLSIQKKFSDF